MESVDPLELARRLIGTRKALGLTQTKLAEKAGKSPATISGLESGKIARPHLGTILDLAEALDITPAELTGVLASPKESSPLSLEEVLREARTTARYLPLSLEGIGDLYESASFKEAQAITQALIAERRAFDAFLTQNPDTKVAGNWRTAVHRNMWAALVGMQGAAQREIDRMRSEGNEAGAEAVREAYGLTVQELAGVS